MEEKRFTLRMDGELFEEITQLAKMHRRSVAKEIEVAVEHYVRSYIDSPKQLMYIPVPDDSKDRK